MPSQKKDNIAWEFHWPWESKPSDYDLAKSAVLAYTAKLKTQTGVSALPLDSNEFYLLSEPNSKIFSIAISVPGGLSKYGLLKKLHEKLAHSKKSESIKQITLEYMNSGGGGYMRTSDVYYVTKKGSISEIPAYRPLLVLKFPSRALLKEFIKPKAQLKLW
jgi:hypothetical protein